MQPPYTPPSYWLEAFNCPHCMAYSSMSWTSLWARDIHSNIDFSVARCTHCRQDAMWENLSQSMISPAMVTAPLAHSDLPDDCCSDYNEARQIASSSPRSAAALLRLCIQKLCVHLGGKGRKIDDDIGTLVKQGLPIEIQQALDVVRVVGNNAVHPGELSIDDDPQLVHALFGLVNMIVDNRITQPKKVAEMFAGLPAGALQAIARRDGNDTAQ